jgi:hypothetical protein
MKKAIVFCALAFVLMSCGDDDSAEEPALSVDEPVLESNSDGSSPDGSSIETPPNFPIVFPEGGDVVTVDNTEGDSPIESVVVVYPDGDLEQLAAAIRVQLPEDAQEASGGRQVSFTSSRVIVNVSEQPDGVWVSVSSL